MWVFLCSCTGQGAMPSQYTTHYREHYWFHSITLLWCTKGTQPRNASRKCFCKTAPVFSRTQGLTISLAETFWGTHCNIMYSQVSDISYAPPHCSHLFPTIIATHTLKICISNMAGLSVSQRPSVVMFSSLFTHLSTLKINPKHDILERKSMNWDGNDFFLKWNSSYFYY